MTDRAGDCQPRSWFHSILGGLWWIKDAIGEAHGSWAEGSWIVVNNTTSLTDDEIDNILDSNTFWPGVPADDEWYTAVWDNGQLTGQ